MNQPDTHLFGLYLIHVVGLDESVIFEALEIQRQSIIPIGKLAMELRIMTMRGVMDVLSAQAGTNDRFGEVAIQLQYLDEDLLNQLLDIQADKKEHLGSILISMGVLSHHERDILLDDFLESIVNHT